MSSSEQSFKRKLILSFSIMTALIICSGIIGWVITAEIEKTNSVINSMHLLKEAELQLRKEEKNFLIRGYSTATFNQWQKAKEDFYHILGKLEGMNALTADEIKGFDSTNSALANIYKNFFDDVRSGKLTDDQITKYDKEFKEYGSASLQLINNSLNRNQAILGKLELRSNILIVLFTIAFAAIASSLVISVLRNL
ncbi:MAG: hypothetical protein ACP5US_05660 [Candidatus Kryptoniota bacterium]